MIIFAKQSLIQEFMEGLNIDFIQTPEEIDNLFTGGNTETNGEPSTTNGGEEKHGEHKTEDPVDVDNLFSDGDPESVGSVVKNGQEETGHGAETSPNDETNFYSSTLDALVKDGVLSGLNDEDLAKVKTAEDFAEAINKVVESRFDESQKRINDALNAGVEPTEIKKNESIIKYLDSITEEDITANDEEADKLRSNIIAQDMLNRGYSEDKIKRELKKSFDAGTDIEDAKEALAANKEYYKNIYKDLVDKEQKARKEQDDNNRKSFEELKKSIMEDKDIFGALPIDKQVRQKIYDNISKASYRDDKTGQMLTAVQKYQRENPKEFIKNLGIIYTLTDGFSNIEKLIQSGVKRQMKSSLRELEHTLSNTSRNSDGSLNLLSGVTDDNSPEYFGKGGWRLDV